MTQKFALAARLLLGLIFFVFGLNGFFLFIPVPPMAEPATEFMKALMDTTYMLPLIKSVEVLGGLLLLLGRFVPLALVLLGPVVVNIALFHLLLDPGNAAISLLLFFLWGFLLFFYRSSYYPLLVSRNGRS